MSIAALSGPRAAFAERHVVAGALRDADVVLASDLDASDFCAPQAQVLWSAMQRAVLGSRWRNAQELLIAAAGGDPEQADRLYGWLASTTASRDDALHFADQVRTFSLSRRALAVLASAEDRVAHEVLGADLVSQTVDELLELQARQTRASSKSLAELVTECSARTLARRDGDDDAAPGALVIPTSLTRIDEAIGGGWQGGVVSVVGARTSHGKSAFLLQCAIVAALAGHTVHVLSAEDLESDTAFRAASRATGIPMPLLRRGGQLDLEQEQQLRRAAAGELNDAFSRITLSQVAGKTHEQIAALSRIKPADLVLLDYLQRIHVPTGQKRYDVFTAAMNTFDTLAKQSGACWVVASQFKRSEREYPDLQDLREAGTIEEIAKCVIGLYRPGKGTDNDDRIWVGVLKASNDALASGEFVWDGERVSILDCAPRQRAPWEDQHAG